MEPVIQCKKEDTLVHEWLKNMENQHVHICSSYKVPHTKEQANFKSR